MRKFVEKRHLVGIFGKFFGQLFHFWAPDSNDRVGAMLGIILAVNSLYPVS
jgi:hypothetical protein